MRFVFAIVAFIAAAVMIGLGIAQRTVFLESDRVSLDLAVDSSEADYVVISPEALAAYPGKQAITIAGEGTTYLAYGRTADVLAWLGDDRFIEIGFDAEAGELTSTLIDPTAVDEDGSDGDEDASDGSPTATPVPTTPAPTTPAQSPDAAETEDADAVTEVVSPAGSDLWLDERSEEQSRLSLTIDVPSEVSVLVASGSQDPVPDRIGIAWPLDNSTPWVGPLLTGGTIVFLVGVWLVISGILHHRRSRGPRRNLPKGPKGKLLLAPKPGKAQLTSGRRSAGRRAAVAALVLVPVFGLTACSPEYWPSFDGADATAEPTPTPMPTPGAEDATDEEPVEPAVTVPQMERIMGKVATTTATADGALDPVAAEQRFIGPALEARKTNYVIRAALPDQPGPVAVPQPTPDQVVLPQQTKAGVWPRTVLTIVQNGDDPTVAPSALVLVQETPRENFKILYTTELVPDADVPDLAPASIGAPSVTVDSKLLVMPPSQVGAAFADILMKGAESPSAASFDLEATDLDDKLNAAARKAEQEGANPTLTLDVSAAAGEAPVVALATNDAGALVSTTVKRTEVSRPNDGGTTGFREGTPARALSGFTAQSAKGVQSTRALQLLFYVPKVGSDEPIRLLGWSENLISASEVP